MPRGPALALGFGFGTGSRRGWGSLGVDCISRVMSRRGVRLLSLGPRRAAEGFAVAFSLSASPPFAQPALLEEPTSGAVRLF